MSRCQARWRLPHVAVTDGGPRATKRQSPSSSSVTAPLAHARTRLEAALKDATQYANAIAGQGSRDALEATRKAGKTWIFTFNDVGKAECCTALLPVRKDVKGGAGKEVLAAVDKESALLAVKQGALPARLARRGGCAAQ